jgi:hypothetical protein
MIVCNFFWILLIYGVLEIKNFILTLANLEFFYLNHITARKDINQNQISLCKQTLNCFNMP